MCYNELTHTQESGSQASSSPNFNCSQTTITWPPTRRAASHVPEVRRKRGHQYPTPTPNESSTLNSLFLMHILLDVRSLLTVLNTFCIGIFQLRSTHQWNIEFWLNISGRKYVQRAKWECKMWPPSELSARKGPAWQQRIWEHETGANSLQIRTTL